MVVVGEGGGGERIPYISHIGMCHPKAYGFAPFRSENGEWFCPFWSEIGYGIRGNFGGV